MSGLPAGGVARVLVVASPMVGHVLPLVPLARAMAHAGAEVLVATAADGVGAARAAGLPVRDVAPGLAMPRLMVRSLARSPVAVLRMIGGDEGTAGVGRLFATVTGQMAPGVVALAEEWRPDLVLHEGLAPAGALAAARLGVPCVLVDALLFDGVQLFRAVAVHLDRLLHRYGLTALAGPDEVVRAAPTSVVGRRSGRPMRYLPGSDPGSPVPDDLRAGRRRTLLVTRSTVADPRRDRMMSTVVEAARGADVDVVLVRPDRWVTRRPLPATVRTTGWLSFADAFPLVAGVVHHGGAGTLLTALAAGVPQLVVPGAGDRTVHARLVARRGAGLAVALPDLTPAVLERLVGEPGLRSAAGEVAAEIAAMPHPAELVAPLLALAGRSPH